MKKTKTKHPFIKKVDGWNVHYTNGYIVDKRIFILATIVVLGFGTYLYAHYGFTGYEYVSCPNDTLQGRCYNPLYKENAPSCTGISCREYLVAGETYGTPPPSEVVGYPMFCLKVLFAAFVVNTLVFLQRRKSLFCRIGFHDYESSHTGGGWLCTKCKYTEVKK